jgi:hypothetical protein
VGGKDENKRVLERREPRRQYRTMHAESPQCRECGTWQDSSQLNRGSASTGLILSAGELLTFAAPCSSHNSVAGSNHMDTSRQPSRPPTCCPEFDQLGISLVAALSVPLVLIRVTLNHLAPILSTAMRVASMAVMVVLGNLISVPVGWEVIRALLSLALTSGTVTRSTHRASQ